LPETIRRFGHIPGAPAFDPEDSAFWFQHGGHFTEAGTQMTSPKVRESGEGPPQRRVPLPCPLLLPSGGKNWQLQEVSRVTDTPPIFLTIAECAELLRLSERSVYGMARTGELPGAVKVGGKWRVERATLMATLRAQVGSSERRSGKKKRASPTAAGEVMGWRFTLCDSTKLGRPFGPSQPLVVRGTWDNDVLYGGLHVFDALRYAEGSYLWRVKVGGVSSREKGRAIGTSLTALWGFDAGQLLKEFARRCALDVIDLWDAPEVVVQYLKTGDERLLREARALFQLRAGSGHRWPSHSRPIALRRAHSHWRGVPKEIQEAAEIATHTVLKLDFPIVKSGGRKPQYIASSTAFRVGEITGDAGRVRQRRRLAAMVGAEVRRRK